jgi:glycerophosphoryl diester phosphodiesterase
MSIIIYALAIYAVAYVLLFCFPTLIHRKRKYKVCERMMEGRRVKTIPHRGGLFENYENSLSAFAHCKAMGVFGIELDVHRTKDRQFIVCHDSSLKRLTGQDEIVEQINYSEIGHYLDTINPVYTEESFQRTNASKERPPLLEEVFQLLQDTDIYINIDVKSNSTEDVVSVCKLISKYNYQDRVIIGFMMGEECKNIMRSMNLDLPVFFNVREVFKFLFALVFGLLPFMPLKYDFMSITGYFESVKGNPMFKQNRGIRCVLMFYNLLTPVLPLVNWHLNRRGIPVAYWILNTHADFNIAVRMGANAIMSDRPTKLRDYLLDRKLH